MRIQTLIGGILTRAISPHVNSMSLVSNAEESQTLPSQYNFVVISCTSNIYVKLGASAVTAAIPGDVTNGTAAELNPTAIKYDPQVDVKISVISPSNCTVTLSYYNIGE